MKLVVSALASILPQGEGIELFNHLIYEGLPVTAQFSQKQANQQILFAALAEQLKRQQINDDVALSNEETTIILRGGFNSSHFESANNLCEALDMAKHKLQTGCQRVNIFAFQIDNKTYVDEVQPLAFSENYDFLSHKKGSHFALGFTVSAFSENSSNYYAVIEAFDVIDELQKNAVEVVETTANQSLAQLKSEFTFCAESYDIALGSVATSLGYGNSNLDMAAFIKGVLQCYHRYIGGVPNWQKKNPVLPWENSGFYICEQSKSWFVKGQDKPRYCLVNITCETQAKQIVLSDRGVSLERSNQYFAYATPHLFPLAGNDLSEFQMQLTQLNQDIKNCLDYFSLRRLAKHYYQNLLDVEDSIDIKQYRAVVLAENTDNLLQEIDALAKALPDVFANSTQHEIKTPKGSYFTAEPLGEEGKVAFVFPGLGSSYVGLGQKIFQLFPSIFKESFRFTQNVGEELQEKKLYPRLQDALSFKEKKQRDMDIVMNLKDLGKTDTTYSSICAHVMTDVFKVHPDMAFGYSMGEANMMTALDVWQTPTQLENRFKQSDIFKNRLYGELKTVKKFWGESETCSAQELWATFSLKANKQVVADCIQTENLQRVFITLINTEDSVVIAGYPQECVVLLEKLACRALPMGFVPAIHCLPAAQEYEGIAELYSMPTTDGTSTKLYSSSCYLPVPVRQKAIAYAIAKCFCEPVDFPRLVNKVYHDGARIFLEAGAGRTCSTWIDKILADKKHVIVPLNAKGTEDSLTFARVMAKLFCHKVDVNLAPLYDNVE